MATLSAPYFNPDHDHSRLAAGHSDTPPVLNRLHALFSSNAEAGPSRSRRGSSDVVSPIGDEVHRASTEPVLPVPRQVKDRNAFVIKLVTWNMGDALPKGDLSVLLGTPPTYQPLNWEEGFPVTPVEDAHPYHIVVVAGQECPTESGAPRGIGGGLMKGVKLPLHKRGKAGDKEQKDGEPISGAGYGKGKEKELGLGLGGWPGREAESLDKHMLHLGVEESEASGTSAESTEVSRASSPVPSPTPQLHRHYYPSNAKGWSTMLDDWLCGPLPKSARDDRSQSSLDSPANTPNPSVLGLESPTVHRSAPAPFGPSQSSQPPHFSHLAPPRPSPLARTPSTTSFAPSTTDSDSSASDIEPSIPYEPPTPRPASPQALYTLPRDRPQIVIPSDEVGKASPIEGSKCYLHLMKQRLMGMYLSIYIHKDLRNLVEAVDKAYVTAGLGGGRLGNKGGVGISLKIAGHRFLFVNSHLAAHASRNEARLANIAKIKQELKLSCFLPKDDPRSLASDLTERFDTVFWCGDLNFRLDLTRLHAEWLIEQKRYEEALSWDQLRTAMKDPARNPFPGFEEGPINFKPTFKYNVFKSIKATNRDLKRSLRRQNSNTASPAKTAELGSSLGAQSFFLDHVPEAHPTEELAEDDALSRTSEDDDPLRSPDLSKRSFESGLLSPSRTDPGELEVLDRPGNEAELNGYANSHRPLEVTIKEKTKKMFSLMKLRTHLSPSSSKSKPPPRTMPTVLPPKQSRDFDETSRRTSLSSLASMREREMSPDTPAEPRFLEQNGLLSPIEAKTQPLDISRGPPPQPGDSPKRHGRSFSLKRTLSGRSFKGGSSLGDSDEDDDFMKEDRREGVYDSSKKQRVPSWCDRVLWKAHPIPDTPEPPAPTELPVDAEDRSRPFGRLSSAMANFGLHFKPNLGRSLSVDPSLTPPDRTRSPSPIKPSADTSMSATLVDSPDSTPLALARTRSPDGLVPKPRPLAPVLTTPNRPKARALTFHSPESPPPSPLRHPLLTRAGSQSQSTSPARPHITIDPASSPSQDRVSRPRSNSDTLGKAGGSAAEDSLSFAQTAPSFPPKRRLTGETPPRSISGLTSSGETAESKNPLGLFSRTRTLTLHPQDSHGTEDKDEQGNAFRRFLKDLPNWLHRHSQPVVPQLTGEREPEVPPAQKRHLRGEVVCLGYGTIDDAGMRALEGRSDHRPAIFSAAVYV